MEKTISQKRADINDFLDSKNLYGKFYCSSCTVKDNKFNIVISRQKHIKYKDTIEMNLEEYELPEFNGREDNNLLK